MKEQANHDVDKEQSIPKTSTAETGATETGTTPTPQERLLKEKTGQPVDVLADRLGITPSQLEDIVQTLQAQGLGIGTNEGTLYRTKSAQDSGTHDFSRLFRGRYIKFGLISDTHLSSKRDRLDALSEMYDIFAREGINYVFHCGDLTEGQGVYKGQELEVRQFGQEEQIAYAISRYPKRVGIRTFWICLSPDTEVFVNGEWQTYENIKAGDKVLSLDPETGEVKEAEAEDRQVLDYEGDLIHFKNSNLDFLVTPDHAVLSRVMKYKYKYKSAHTIKRGRKIPVAGLIKRKDYPVTDTFIELLGWVVTEGSYLTGGRGIQIYQSKTLNPRKCADIECALQAEGLKTKTYKGKGEGNVVYYIPKAYSQKIKKFLPKKLDISKLIKILSVRQMRLLLKVLIDGDGSWRTSTSYCFYSVLSKELCEQVQLLCVLSGYRAKLKSREKIMFGYKRTEHYVQITQRQDVQLGVETVIESVPYSGVVFDLTTSAGNFLCRRKGSPFFTGNCGNHDLKMYERGGVDPGLQIQRARPDMPYLGQYSTRVKLTRGVEMELLHPAGGSAYALTYKMQRHINALGTKRGDRPSILAMGHWHYAAYAHYQDIHGLMVPSFKDKGSFEKRLALGSDIGGWVIEATLSTDRMVIERFKPELIEKWR